MNHIPKLRSTSQDKAYPGLLPRGTLLFLITAGVITPIMTLCIKPRATQVLLKVLKIPWKPNHLKPLCCLEGEGFCPQHGAGEVSVPALLLPAKHS